MHSREKFSVFLNSKKLNNASANGHENVQSQQMKPNERYNFEKYEHNNQRFGNNTYSQVIVKQNAYIVQERIFNWKQKSILIMR